MEIKFYGTRGSIPVPEPDYMKYGGDTSCVEVSTSDGKRLILDAGTGIRKLGMEMMKAANGESISCDILITHGHWDHIQGFPFFGPAYVPGNNFTFYGLFKADGRVEESLRGMMGQLYFPVHLDQIAGQLKFQDILEGTRDINGILVSCCVVNHPQGALAYRIEYDGAAIVYCPDTEHTPDNLQPKLIDLCQDAEFLIHDSHFSPEEFENHRDWGHSTYEAGIALARAAEVKTLVLFHHAPEHNDAFMDKLVSRALEEWSHVIPATRNLSISTHRKDTRSLQWTRQMRQKAESSIQGYVVEKRDAETVYVFCPSSRAILASNAFSDEVKAAIVPGIKHLKMDFRMLDVLNSVCIGSLGRILAHCRNTETEITFLHVKQPIYEVLRVTRFTEVVNVQTEE